MEKTKGFTLIELLVVVAIIGVLGAIGIVAYNGYTKSAKKAVSKKQHADVVRYIKNELTKCEIGDSTTMDGHLDCDEKMTTNKIGIAVQNAFANKFINPFKNFKENSVALNGPHADRKCFSFNHGGVMVSDVIVNGQKKIRVSSCYGEPLALYTEFNLY